MADGGGSLAGRREVNTSADTAVGGAAGLDNFANADWVQDNNFALLQLADKGSVTLSEGIVDDGLGGISGESAAAAADELQLPEQEDQRQGFESSAYDDGYGSVVREDAFLSTSGLLSPNGLGGLVAGEGLVGGSDAEGQGRSTFLDSFSGELSSNIFGYGAGGLDGGIGMGLGTFDFFPDVYNMTSETSDFDFVQPTAKEGSEGMVAIDAHEDTVELVAPVADVVAEIAPVPEVITEEDQADAPSSSTAERLEDAAAGLATNGSGSELLAPTKVEAGRQKKASGTLQAYAPIAEVERHGQLQPEGRIEGEYAREEAQEAEEAEEAEETEEAEEEESLADSFSDRMSVSDPFRSEKDRGIVLMEQEILDVAQEAEDEDGATRRQRENVCFPSKPVTRSESTVRILELNRIENNIINLLETASRAVQVLASPTRSTIENPGDAENESRERITEFDYHIGEYFRLLDEIQDNLRRHLRFLSKAGVSSHASPGRLAPHSTLAATLGSGVQQLLPFRGSAHGDAKDLEIWTRAAGILRRGIKGLATEASADSASVPLSPPAFPRPPPPLPLLSQSTQSQIPPPHVSTARVEAGQS